MRHDESDPGAHCDGHTVVGKETSVFSRALDLCGTVHERAQCGLEALIALGEATGGFLVGVTRSGPTCCARVGEVDLALEKWACDYLLRQMGDEFQTDELSPQPADDPANDSLLGHPGTRFLPVLLTHPVDGGLAITGVAVLRSTGLQHAASLSAPAAELSRACSHSGDFIETVV